MRGRDARKKIKILSFSLFDTGETILGALAVSTLFPLYITKHVDVKVYSFLYSLSYLISFLFALILGKIADEKGLRKRFFSIFSFLTFLSLSLVSVFYNLPYFALIFFLLMLIFHQQTMIFYNSLLLNFEERGITSGIGVAFGYLGSALSLLFLAEKIKGENSFFIVGLIFFLLSLPAILFLEEVKGKAKIEIFKIFSEKRFIFFIISLLFITEVANTLIAMMGVYLREVFGLQDFEIYKVIGFSAFGGIFGGFLWGFLTDKLGVNFTFPLGFFLWITFLTLLYFSEREALIFVGFLGGLSLSHLWTTSRVFIIENFPKETVSVRMSFLSLTERVASTLGMSVWAIFLLITDNNFRLSALLMIIFPILGALTFFLKVYKQEKMQ